MTWLIKTEVAVEDSFLHDVMTTAVEGGINYWAGIGNLVRAEDLAVTSLAVRDLEGRENGGRYVAMASGDIATAIQAILEPGQNVSGRIVDDIRRAITEGDAGEIDADAADVIVQYVAFGKLVFG